MFGWEFPPYVSGGLGVACEGLVKGLLELSTEIVLVLPRPARSSTPALRILDAGIAARASPTEHPRTRRERRVLLKLRRVRTLLRPYLTEEAYEEEIETLTAPDTEAPAPVIYGPDLHAEVLRFAEEAARIAARESLRRDPRPRLDDVHGGHAGQAREREAPGPSRPRHRVRPLGRRERLRDCDRARRRRGGRPRRRGVVLHGRRSRVALRRAAREASGRSQRHRSAGTGRPLDGRRRRPPRPLRRKDHVAEGA